MDCTNIEGKTVVITGASSGLGEATARYLAERGATVLDDRWPRTAAVLRSIADTYRRDAGRHDVDAELVEDFW